VPPDAKAVLPLARQARLASIAGQSAQPTAPAKRRGLSRSGFAATAVPNALPMLNGSKAP
jgi:hypothetical protein